MVRKNSPPKPCCGRVLPVPYKVQKWSSSGCRSCHIMRCVHIKFPEFRKFPTLLGTDECHKLFTTPQKGSQSTVLVAYVSKMHKNIKIGQVVRKIQPFIFCYKSEISRILASWQSRPMPPRRLPMHRNVPEIEGFVMKNHDREYTTLYKHKK